MARTTATVGINTHKRPGNGSVEDVTDPKQTQDPAPHRDPPQPRDSENPPNENIKKDPDEAYGDTEIPHRTGHGK
jgi:hypothetical protein